MGVHAALNWFVVVRHDGQDGVGTRSFGVLGQFDGVGGRIRAGSRDHRYPTACNADSDADECVMLCETRIEPVGPRMWILPLRNKVANLIGRCGARAPGSL